MMENINFELSFKYSEIFEEVKKITTTLAKSRTDKAGQNLLDLANITSADEPVFIRLVAKAESEIFDGIARYMKSNDPDVYFDGAKNDLKVSKSNITYSFSVPEHFNTYNIKYIYQLILWAFVDNISFQWLVITYPTEAAIYKSKFDIGLNDITSKLNARTSLSSRTPRWI